jgi:hypothetical protein
LPWRPGATAVNWDDSDFLGRTDWSLDISPKVNEGVYVTFSFFQGTGDQAPRINGTLRLQWAGAPAAYPVLNGAALANVQRATGMKLHSASEQTLGRLVEVLSPDIREGVRNELTAVASARAGRAVVYDNVPQRREVIVDLAAVQPLGIGDLVPKMVQDVEKADRIRQLQEVLQRYGIR